MEKSRPRTSRIVVWTFYYYLLTTLILLVGTAILPACSGRGIYAGCLPALDTLRSLSEPPGWIKRTEKLYGRGPEPYMFPQSTICSREYEVKGSVDAVSEFFSTWWVQISSPYTSDPKEDPSFYRTGSEGCLYLQLSRTWKGTVKVHITWVNNYDCLR